MMKRKALPCALALLALVIPGGVVAAQGSDSPRVDSYTELKPGGDPVVPRVTAGPSARTAADGNARRGGGHGGGGAGANGGPKLLTGFGDYSYNFVGDADRSDLLDDVQAVNGSVMRLEVIWRDIAPSKMTAGFDPTDPASPEYQWDGVDAAVRAARARGLRVILLVRFAPDWAEGPNRDPAAAPGTWKPKPKAVADFGEALARRYSGSFKSLPRVRDYMLWNEPNLVTELTPQFNGNRPASPKRYRLMLNAFYDAVHGVDRGDRVITGGTAPYGADPGVLNVRPLEFWRDVMCIKDDPGLSPKRCKVKPEFDVLAHHPINTSGGPHKSALDPDDVSTPDLHNLVDVLRSAEDAGNVLPAGHRPVWADEIWWESNPPDPAPGNPSPALQARWYEESFYSLWKQGASMVLLLQIRDTPYDGMPGRYSFQTGAYYSNGRPKPAARAMAFPFVAYHKAKGKVLLWGIAPESGKVVVTQKGRGPKKVVRFKAKAGRVFTKRVKLHGSHKLKAKSGSTRSLTWDLKK